MTHPADPPVVWITGASSGIGAALARAYAKQGALLILSARRTDKLLALQQTLVETQTLILPLDLTRAGAIGPAAERALGWRGRVDVLVNNAGVSQRSSVQDTELSTGRQLMEVNFFGAAALTRALLPSMLKRRAGQVVNITSVAAYVAGPDRAFYSASKHALRAWSNTLRAELGGSGVHVTMICPGYVATDISQHALDGHGAALRRRDPMVAAGLSPDQAAARMLPAIARKEREVRLGSVEIAAIYLQRFTPWLVAWVLPERLPRADAGPLAWLRRGLRAIWKLPPPPRQVRPQHTPLPSAEV
jgi:short-subunit dehydrogenase